MVGGGIMPSENVLKDRLRCPVCGAACELVVTVRYVKVPAIVATDNVRAWYAFEGTEGKRVASQIESVYCSSCDWAHPWPEIFLGQ